MSELNEKLLEIKNQKDTYIIPGNLKKDVTVFGITGTYEGSGGSGDVKLFETVEEMQEDPNPQEGDLAVVYREEIQPVTEESEFDSCVFPNTVVLDEAFSDEIYGSFRSTGSDYFEGYVELSLSNFRFNGYGDSSEIRVQYESQDGITYTRTGGGEELQEFGTTIKYEPMEPWNDVFSKFMKIGENYFDGLFNYSASYVDRDLVQLIDFDDVTVTFNGSTLDVTWNGNYLSKIWSLKEIGDFIKQIADDEGYTYFEYNYNSFFLNENNQPCLIQNIYQNTTTMYGQFGYGLYDLNGNYKGMFKDGSTGNSVGADVYVLDFENKTYTKQRYNSKIYYYMNRDLCTYIELQPKTVPIRINAFGKFEDGSSSVCRVQFTDGFGESNKGTKFYDNGGYNVNCYANVVTPKYIITKTQLNATSDYVYEKTFYGKNGIEIGSMQNVTDLSLDELKTKVNLLNTMYDLGIQSLITSLASAFSYNTDLKILPNIDITNVTEMNNMCSGCTSLIEIPKWDYNGVINMQAAFSGCTSITELPSIDLSTVKYPASIVSSCTNLVKTAEEYDMTACVNAQSMFSSTGIITAPRLLNMTSAKWLDNMFASCANLVDVPEYNIPNVETMNRMFYDCLNLSDDSLNNIMAMCVTATKIATNNKKLSYLSLTSAQADKCKTLSNYNTFISAGWTTGY